MTMSGYKQCCAQVNINTELDRKFLYPKNSIPTDNNNKKVIKQYET